MQLVFLFTMLQNLGNTLNISIYIINIYIFIHYIYSQKYSNYMCSQNINVLFQCSVTHRKITSWKQLQFSSNEIKYWYRYSLIVTQTKWLLTKRMPNKGFNIFINIKSLLKPPKGITSVDGMP